MATKIVWLICAALFFLLGGVLLFTWGYSKEFSVDFDLVKIRTQQQLSNYSSITVEPVATVYNTVLGATVKNGSPYSFGVCVNNEIEKAPIIKKVDFYVFTGNKKIPVDFELQSIDDWMNRGAISCISNLFSFDAKIKSEAIYCLDIQLNSQNNNEDERACWQFKREVGEYKMSLELVLKQ